MRNADVPAPMSLSGMHPKAINRPDHAYFARSSLRHPSCSSHHRQNRCLALLPRSSSPSPVPPRVTRSPPSHLLKPSLSHHQLRLVLLRHLRPPFRALEHPAADTISFFPASGRAHEAQNLFVVFPMVPSPDLPIPSFGFEYHSQTPDISSFSPMSDRRPSLPDCTTTS